MRRQLLTCSAVSIIAFAVGVAAQAPASSTQPQASAAQSSAIATVEGCLVNEQDVPGRKPDVVEQANIGRDYILTNAKMVKGAAPTTAAARSDQPVGTSGGTLAPMYDVKGLDGDKLKPLVGKRVQIEGTFDDLTKSANAGPTQDLVDIKGVTIREVPGDCPAK